MKSKAIFILITIFIAAALFWVFNPAKSVEVEAINPQRGKAVQAVYATGTVEASRMIPVSPKIAARLMELNVDEGDQVEAGQILARLEDTDLQQNVTELEARRVLAQKDLERAQKLGRSGAISKEGLDTAQANFAAADASYERSKAELGYLHLVAPEAGTIIRRDGEIGELVTPATTANAGTPVFWINGGNSIRIETEVDEEDIGLVKNDQDVLVSADAFAGQTFNGTVQSITPKGDPVARSYRVRISLPQQTPLMIGMTAETNIITQVKDNALMVPATSVNNGKVVVLGGGKAKIVDVKTGIKTPDAIEITEGVEESATLAHKFDATLADKGRISAKTTEWKRSAE